MRQIILECLRLLVLGYLLLIGIMTAYYSFKNPNLNGIHCTIKAIKGDFLK